MKAESGQPERELRTCTSRDMSAASWRLQQGSARGFTLRLALWLRTVRHDDERKGCAVVQDDVAAIAQAVLEHRLQRQGAQLGVGQ